MLIIFLWMLGCSTNAEHSAPNMKLTAITPVSAIMINVSVESMTAKVTLDLKTMPAEKYSHQAIHMNDGILSKMDHDNDAV